LLWLLKWSMSQLWTSPLLILIEMQSSFATIGKRRLQPAVQTFCGIVSKNNPLSDKVRDDHLMDLYYLWTYQLYLAESDT
jgi:hypothetical protein